MVAVRAKTDRATIQQGGAVVRDDLAGDAGITVRFFGGLISAWLSSWRRTGWRGAAGRILPGRSEASRRLYWRTVGCSTAPCSRRWRRDAKPPSRGRERPPAANSGPRASTPGGGSDPGGPP